MLAAIQGHLDIVKFIVPLVTNYDRIINGGTWTLMWAAWGGHIEVVRYLINTGVNLNPSAQLGGRGTGYTALMFAAR